MEAEGQWGSPFGLRSALPRGTAGAKPGSQGRSPAPPLARRGQFVQELDVAANGAVQALDLRVFRLDQVVFVGRVRAIAAQKC